MNHSRIPSFLLALLAAGAAFAARPAKSNDSPRAQGAQRGASSNANAKTSGPKVYENAENQFRFKAPGNWNTASGGPTGSLFNLALPIDSSSLPPVKRGEGVLHVYGDLFTVVVNPPKSPGEDLTASVADVQEQIKKSFSNAEFKPVEKTKFAGLDAAVLTASIVSDKPGEAKLIHRHTIFQRDGKVFQIALWAHENTLARDTKLLRNVLSTFEWTGAAKPTSAPAPAEAAVDKAPVPAPKPAAAPAPAAPAKPAKPAAPAAKSGDGID